MLKRLHPVRHWVCLLPAVLLCGCGSDRPETVPVSGRVTFDGGPPPAAGVVSFLPIAPAEGYPSRPATARFDTDGRFTAESYAGSRGLVPGRYRVAIECWRQAPDETIEQEGVSHVPADLQLPELDVPPGGRAISVDYDVPTGG